MAHRYVRYPFPCQRQNAVLASHANTLSRAHLSTRRSPLHLCGAVLTPPFASNSMSKHLLAVAMLCVFASTVHAQSEKQGVMYRAPSGVTLKLLLDETNVGPEVSVGELTFPPNSDSGDHAHGAIEMFYVLSGELEHIVNGKSLILKAGMTGFVRPPDKVRHKTGPAGAKVLVIWAPGDEAKKIAARWQKEP